MKCTKPLKVETNYGKIVKVPCGYCRHCRIDYKREWQIRLIQELKSSTSGSFITLTYDSFSLPYKEGKPTLVKKHLSNFIKRLRRNAEKSGWEERIRFFGVGEYGEKRGRPHYHVLLFNIPVHHEDKKLENEVREWVSKAWSWYDKSTKEREPIGMIDYGKPKGVTSESIAYVLGYCLKKQDKNNRGGRTMLEKRENRHGLLEEEGVQVEFKIASKGIGKQYLTEQTKEFHKHFENGYMFNHVGSKVKLPTYYEKRLFETEEEYYAWKLDKYEYLQKNGKLGFGWRKRLELLEEWNTEGKEYEYIETSKGKRKVYNRRGLSESEKRELKKLRKRYVKSIKWADIIEPHVHRKDTL